MEKTAACPSSVHQALLSLPGEFGTRLSVDLVVRDPCGVHFFTFDAVDIASGSDQLALQRIPRNNDLFSASREAAAPCPASKMHEVASIHTTAHNNTQMRKQDCSEQLRLDCTGFSTATHDKVGSGTLLSS